MINIGGDPGKRKVPAFSLDRKDINAARARPGLNRVEWRLILFMPLMVAVLGWTIWDWRDKIAALREGAFEPIPAMAPLKAMSRPVLDGLPDLPDATALDVARTAAEEAVAANQPPPLLASGLDAQTIAWARARLAADLAAPPLPSRLSARDLILTDHVRVGTALIIEGRLEDRIPAPLPGEGKPWQRLLVAIDEGQFAEVLAGPASADLVLGRPVRVVGRLMGYDELPVPPSGQAAAKGQAVPLVLGRIVHEQEQAATEDPLADYHRPWSMPSDLWSEVDDFRLWTETRPYYHLLGQVKLDRSTEGAWNGIADGNRCADDIHLDPAAYRGKPFKVVGYVYHAWEDQDVAHDQPFGVGRVVRVLLWRRDLAPVTETLNGVTTRKEKLVLRLYEIAAITDQPLPEHGAMLVAQGRFLKKRAIPVVADPLRDRLNGVQRQSDRVYTWMFVTDGWEDLGGPAKYNFTPVSWVISGLITIGLLIGVWWWWREVRGDGKLVSPWGRRSKPRHLPPALAPAPAASESAPPPPAATDAPPPPPAS